MPEMLSAHLLLARRAIR